MAEPAFQISGVSVLLTATVGGARTPIPTPHLGCLALFNLGAADVCFAFGTVATTCTLTTGGSPGCVLPGRGSSILTIPPGATHLYAIADGASTNINVTPGGGV